MTHEQLEKEVELLRIRLEALVTYLVRSPIGLGALYGRENYDKQVEAILKEKGLQE